MSKKPELELFDNPKPERDYCITIRCPEFTSVCPRTGQPDFGEILIEYCPDKSCVELKSLKFYMQSYRDCKPRWMKVTSRFMPRGGITTEVTAEYKMDK
ncbi:MAG: preQ(1) synthase [Planctomycetota bacterium]|jgi:7-cyano-7-deazaguanine reductase